MIATNVSLDNTSTSEDEVLQGPRTHWAIVAALILVCGTTILANLTVILCFCLEPRLREPFNYFILNLAVPDCMTGAFGMSHLTVYTYYGYWPLGYRHCSFWVYADWLCATEGIINAAVIGLDRLWAAIRPISYRRYNSTRKSLLVILFSWLVVHASILPGQIYDCSNNAEHYGKYECFWDIATSTVWATPLYVVPLTEWIPFGLVVLCYILTARSLYQRSRQRFQVLRSSTENPVTVWTSVQERRWRKERQTFVLLSLLCLAVIICWVPWFVYSILSTYTGYYDWLVYMVTYWICYSISAVNPFLFNFANPLMRQTVQRIFTGKRVVVRRMDNRHQIVPAVLIRGNSTGPQSMVRVETCTTRV